MLGFMALGFAAIFALGRHLFDVGDRAPRRLLPRDGALRRLLADQLPARPAAGVHGRGGALRARAGARSFSRPGWCLVLGVALGLGMVTKPPFAGYVLPVVLLDGLAGAPRGGPPAAPRLARASRSPSASPSRCPGTARESSACPMQIVQPVLQAGRTRQRRPGYLSAESLLYYPRVLPIAARRARERCSSCWGIWTARRYRDSRAFLWLAGIVPVRDLLADPEPEPSLHAAHLPRGGAPGGASAPAACRRAWRRGGPGSA